MLANSTSERTSRTIGFRGLSSEERSQIQQMAVENSSRSSRFRSTRQMASAWAARRRRGTQFSPTSAMPRRRAEDVDRRY